MRGRLPQWASRDRSRVALSFIADTYGSIAAVVLILSAASGLISSAVSLFVVPSPISVAIAGSGLGLAVGISGTMYARYRRLGEHELALGYEWRAASYTYHVDTDDPTIHRQDIKIVIRAVRSGVQLFTNRYSWTGEGSEDSPRATSPGHSLSSIRKTGGWKECFFDLGRPLKRGEEATIELTQRLLDLNMEFDTFLSKDVYEPLQSLVLSIRLPVSRLPAVAEGIEYENPTPGARPVSKAQLSIDRSEGTVTWSISRPRLNRRYELRWMYSDGLGLYGSKT